MPHQCVKCGHLYGEAGSEVVKGCSCGNRIFFFIRKEKMPGLYPELQVLSQEQKAQIEEDVLEIMGEEQINQEPVLLDFEVIHAIEPGKFHIDLVNLFKKNHPFIIKVEDGKYLIDLQETFDKLSRK
ncbi:MAG TPA: Zn-ribbon containing protein [Candidatus Nanoarchaeia archaeon]|nr:Zn-ribbon containing protein [Candidatus Nanoarchaeia archaeon]